MAIGPLETFVFPGVYTRTLVESPTPTAAGSLRYPAIIGVGNEEERVEAFEMVRGSSATADNIILGENVLTNGQAENVVDGINTVFKVRNYPIVDGSGLGAFASKPSEVIVQVDGESVPVQGVDGVQGVITLVDAPAEDTLVQVNYYFKRRDEYIENEDLSNQVDGSNRTFQVRSSRIVKGNNGGESATSSNISDTAETLSNGAVITVSVISVTVNGAPAVIESLNGGAGTFTLVAAPANNETILVNYFTNKFQNTFDILPAAQVTELVRAGYDPNRGDFIEGRDFTLANQNEIHWGSSFSVEPGISTVGSEVFGSNQVTTANMVDWRYYKLEVGSGDGSSKEFTLPFVPVTGEGTGRSLTDPENGTPGDDVDDLKVYVGTSLATAVEVTVLSVRGTTVTLQTAPASGELVFVDSFVNGLQDDTWTISNTTSGGAGVGKYTVVGSAFGSARQVLLDVGASTSTATFLDSGTINWDGVASNASNAYIAPSRTFGDEDITVTIDASGNFTVTSTVSNGTGSSSNNSGTVGQTYIDEVTGFTFALETASAGTLIFNVTKEFTVTVDPELGIPGFKFNVETTEDVTVGDTAIIKTFNMSFDDEPRIGDVYYATFDKAKQDFSVKYFTNFPDILRSYGPLAQNNPIVIAANLAFINGAQAVALKQIPKAPGSSDANVSDYIQAIDEFDDPLDNSTRPALIQVLSTNDQVINYLKASNQQQSSIRFRNERTSYFGFAIGTSPEKALNRAKGLKTELLTAVYPDGGVITIPDENGIDQDLQVGGEYVAVALAGQDVSPARDVATPLTNVAIVGFSRLNRKLNGATAAQVAQAGVTVLENKFGSIKVMMALTTDLSSVLTRDPRIVEVKHFVQQGVRRTCDPFIGLKMLSGLTSKVEKALNSFFGSLVELDLISEYQGVKATVDESDPTIINVEVYYKPVFGLNWIVVTHYLRRSL